MNTLLHILNDRYEFENCLLGINIFLLSKHEIEALEFSVAQAYVYEDESTALGKAATTLVCACSSLLEAIENNDLVGARNMMIELRLAYLKLEIGSFQRPNNPGKSIDKK